MPHVGVRVEGGVAAVVLSRGKVNALDEATIDELNDRFRETEEDEAVRSVVFSGEGKFFSSTRAPCISRRRRFALDWWTRSVPGTSCWGKP